ncbi:hypothetical protein Verru16b_01820 [Lacunisphaera limnophila]|uniref:Spermatogenesis-associated protein 20-like TRX domain-containing protein n=1 Tax=Lacunisphaera limnophila TaxID=1838286 RepID=A0A1D8AV33_9BACT|nr:DUF255 domain-containing protein [Lacunisphaera limnophila]AOS44752.1 hypothetical protein Verru16b_01820 [Lacunisphaera limnophila]
MIPRVLPLCVIMVLAGVMRAAEPSPLAAGPTEFIRAQAGSAVHWQPWTEASLAQARASGKSVYVFVGSPLSELTRATISQTFTSEKTVAWLNENFFCLFVDADAQPDVAAFSQYFIRTVKQLQGSPVHLWLTPDTLQPYDGANYLPPSEEWGKPGFLKAARAALDTWALDPARARALATEAAEMMRPVPLDPAATLAIGAKLDAAAAAWAGTIDPVHGGFGSAPKLPEPELIRFLLTREGPAREAALNAARALVKGALRDPVDGGFYRRCIDDQWKEPYHQKLLADQARIALALFEAAEVGKDEALRTAGIGALDFVLKELRNPDGSFAAALDGTLDENRDAAQRPTFAKVGSGRLMAQALLAGALHRSGEKRLRAEATRLVEKLNRDVYRPAGTARVIPGDTAVDHAALLLAMRQLNGGTAASAPLKELDRRYFDEASGSYQAAPFPLPAGITARVPLLGETPSAEVLALLAGAEAKTADLIQRNLMMQIEYDELPPGDILLGLSQAQK